MRLALRRGGDCLSKLRELEVLRILKVEGDM